MALMSFAQAGQQTPQQTGQTVGNILNNLQMGRARAVATPAMMGDPRALQKLMTINPQMAQQIQMNLEQQRTEQAKQMALEAQKKQQQAKWLKENQSFADKFIQDTADTMAKLPESERESYFNQRNSALKEIVGPNADWWEDMSYQQVAPSLEALAAQKTEKGKWKESDVEGLEGYLFNENTGEYKVSPQIERKIQAAEKKGVELPAKDRTPIINAVGKYTKDLNSIYSAAESLEELTESATAQDKLAAIFKFMKALDPNSTVREGEQEQARRTGGVTDQFITYIDQLKGEGAISGPVLEEMRNTAMRLANAERDSTLRNVESLLNGYQDTIPEDFKATQIKRVPTSFKIGENLFPNAPARGTVKDGYEYIGGNPASQDSWKKVQ